MIATRDIRQFNLHVITEQRSLTPLLQCRLSLFKEGRIDAPHLSPVKIRCVSVGGIGLNLLALVAFLHEYQ
jgi:hypothetical protein